MFSQKLYRMCKFWLPLIYAFICISVFIFHIPLALYVFIYASPLGLVLDHIPFSMTVSYVDSAKQSYLEAPFLKEPIPIPEHLPLVLVIGTSLLFWFVFGVLIDKVLNTKRKAKPRIT
jgi:hypothetical protein